MIFANVLNCKLEGERRLLFNRHYFERHLGAFLSGLLLISSIFVVYNVGTLNAQNSWWNPGWAYRKMITIDHAKASADLTGFPMLVDIADVDLVSKNLFERISNEFQKCQLFK